MNKITLFFLFLIVANLICAQEQCPEAPILTDVDGNVYQTVKIGQQCWMKENLRTTKYADGTLIPSGKINSFSEAIRFYPNNSPSTKNSFGLLYNWIAVMNNDNQNMSNRSEVQGICPDGWHVPSDKEWEQLLSYVNSQNSYKCNSNGAIAKAMCSTTGWNKSILFCAVGNNQGTNNASHFSALPAGNYIDNGLILDFGGSACFWSSTEEDTDYASCFLFYNDSPDVRTDLVVKKSCGFSVRCVKD